MPSKSLVRPSTDSLLEEQIDITGVRHEVAIWINPDGRTLRVDIDGINLLLILKIGPKQLRLEDLRIPSAPAKTVAVKPHKRTAPRTKLSSTSADEASKTRSPKRI